MTQPATTAVEKLTDRRQKIVIVGGGFGGVYTAIALDKLAALGAPVEVTLVSRDNFFLMTPLLFEAGSGTLEPRHAVNPIRPLLTEARFVEATRHRPIDVAAKDGPRRAGGGAAGVDARPAVRPPRRSPSGG